MGARSVDQLTGAGKSKCGMLECYKNRAPRVRLFDTERSAIVTETETGKETPRSTFVHENGSQLCCSLLRRGPDTPDTQSDTLSATTCVPLVLLQGKTREDKERQGKTRGTRVPARVVLTDQAFRVRVLESGQLKVCVMDVSVHSVPSI